MSFITAGDSSKPVLLLLHGFPSSAREFRDVIPTLSQAAYVIAPDFPGSGQSDVLPWPSFAAFDHAISELLDHLAIARRYIYLHDWGPAVGLRIAMHSPDLVAGLIIQNANAHRTGFGPIWDAALKSRSAPTKENEAAAAVDLTLEFTREQYIGGLPEGVAASINGEPWVEDWRVMNLPGRMQTQQALIADYKNHAARFDAIAAYLKKWQPAALMLWGRHETPISTSPRRCRGCRICGEWKRIFSTADTFCSRHTRPRLCRSCWNFSVALHSAAQQNEHQHCEPKPTGSREQTAPAHAGR